ncbi:MAG TPA: branched-chain amino acid ABC transporter permease [Chloroflexota bacterium]|nr:branched-chain amino acid ABC transporter permease [Chloroflexota bacterium]
MRGSTKAILGGLAFCVLLVILSRALSSYYLVLSTRILIFAIFAMSLDLLVGYTGRSSLGHAAFFGFSGYATGLFALKVSNNLILTIGAAVLVTFLMALIFSALALRARGVYFLMLTLALSQVIWGIAFEWRALTGGDDGLPGVPRPVIGPYHLTDSSSFFLFTGGMFVISAAILLLIVRSPFGLTLQGIRESASRMSALGYNVWLHEYLAFLISAIFAGAAGSLLAYQNGIVSPTQLFVVSSAEALLMVILGGAGTMIGPFFGSVVVVLLEYLVSQHTERWVTALGIIYIMVVVGAPRGIYPPMRDFVIRRLRRGKGPKAAVSVPLPEPAPGITMGADT